VSDPAQDRILTIYSTLVDTVDYVCADEVPARSLGRADASCFFRKALRLSALSVDAAMGSALAHNRRARSPLQLGGGPPCVPALAGYADVPAAVATDPCTVLSQRDMHQSCGANKCVPRLSSMWQIDNLGSVLRYPLNPWNRQVYPRASQAELVRSRRKTMAE
jgi:hypothetical protein